LDEFTAENAKTAETDGKNYEGILHGSSLAGLMK
jgi:hypothetical protein